MFLRKAFSFRKRNIFFLLFACISGFVNASNRDSIAFALKLQPEDSSKAKILLRIMRMTSGDSAIYIASEALRVANSSNYKHGEAQADLALGKLYYFKGDFSSSLRHSFQAYKLALETKNYKLAASASLFIGYNHFENKPSVALEYYNNCIYFSKLSKSKLTESYGYSAIGNVYEKWYDGRTALGYFMLSLKIREQHGSSNEVISSLIETARGYNRLSYFEYSNRLIHRALAVAEKNNDTLNLISLYQMVGYDYSDRLNDQNQALTYFLKAYTIASKSNSLESYNIDCIKPVAETYLKLGDSKSASHYYRLYLELQEENRRKIDKKLLATQIDLQKEMEKENLLRKDSEILKQRVEMEKNRNMLYILISSSVVLAVFSFFIYRSSKEKQRINTILDRKVNERTKLLLEANELLLDEVKERRVTEKKLQQSENKLTEINKELESFIYKASHDLKGPLTSSKGLSGLALNANSIEEMKQYVKLIDVSIDKLDGILKDLQELALIRQGRLVYRKCNLEQLIHDVFGHFSGYENFNQIELKIENRVIKDFYCDGILLQAILRNVLENSIKYSDKKISNPYVHITLIDHGNEIKIRISDNGIGIPPEFHSKVFDVFFRANEVAKGSGLGLYIVKSAVNKLKGRIEIESSVPGSGTVLNIFLPYTELPGG